MHAEEQHGGNPAGGAALGMGQRPEPLAGEPLGADDQPAINGRSGRQFGVAAEQQRLDGLLAEHAAELLVQVPGRAEQAIPLGLGHDVGVEHGSSPALRSALMGAAAG